MVTNRGAFIRRQPIGNFQRRFFVRDRFIFDRFHHHHRLFFGSYPFSFGFYPWYWYDAYPGDYGDSYLMGPSSNQAAYDSANAYSASDIELANAVARLSDEVEHLREERQPREALPSRAEPEKNVEPPESVVLVFRDQHTQEVKNYAIVGPTLWILNEQRATKLPLSTLDIEATSKLNEERGIEFRLPK